MVRLRRQVQMRNWLVRIHSSSGGADGDGVHGLFHHGAVRGGCGSRSGIRSLLGGETWAMKDHVAKFLKTDPAVWVHIKDALKNLIKIIGDGKNGLQKAAVFHESSESGIVHGGSLPWVATTSEVDQNDAKGPDIIGRGCITGIGLRIGCLAFCESLASWPH